MLTFYYSLISESIKNMPSAFCPSTQEIYKRRAPQRKQNKTKKRKEPLKSGKGTGEELVIQTRD